MKGVRIYLEGGGDGNAQKQAIRTGFSRFLEPLRNIARQNRKRWNIIACGSRNSAYKSFCTALKQHTDSFIVLLVDSEEPVTKSPWKHLLKRDKWGKPDDASDENCQLMIQVVESWLIADKSALAMYYGNGFQITAIPKNQNVEKIPKSAVTDGLNKATAKTQKGKYKKILHCSMLLQKIDPEVVKNHASSCARFFATIEEKLTQQD